MKNLCFAFLDMDSEKPVQGREREVWEFHNANLTRVPGYGFGIAVSGGRDNPHFADGDPSIAISDVLKSGPAEDKLMINDRIICANGISLENVDYATAVQVLRDCSSSVNLVIKRKLAVPMAEPQTVRVTITRGKKKDDFGVVLGCHIYIKEVTNSNLVDRDGTIHEGDYVLKINNTSAENLSLKEAKKLVESGKERLHLVLRRDQSRPPPGVVENHQWSNIYEQSPNQNKDVPSPPSFADIAGARQQWSNQNLYVQPPTRGDYRPPPPPPERTEDRNNLTRSVNSTGRIRGPLMDISLSQLDQPATPLLANHRPTASIDEEVAPPRPPPPRLDEFINTRGDIYDDDPLSRRSKVPLPDPRFISFQKDGSVGIRLTGGNEVGIFVTAVQPGSPASLQGLQPGDKILKVNDKDMRGITREEAVLFLLRIQDQINLIVQHRKEEYDIIVANQKGDSFYIRTHFTHESNGKGELSFHVAEVFQVIDTLYNGVVGSWMVYRMGRNNQQIQKGIIPNKRRAEELCHEQQNQAKKDAASESRGSFFKRRSARRSKSLSKDHWEDVVFADGLSKFPAYERVTLKHPGFVRPVVLFGPVGDIARDKLLKDYPDKYASPQLDNRMDDIPKSQKSSGIIRLSAIKEIIEKGKHAILDITPSAVDRLNYAQFYPIVIFMKADNKHMVKELRSRLAKSSHKSSKKLYDHSTKLEKLWSHVFTATVTLTSADMWYKKLRETIEKQQQQAIWVSETKPQEAISDDFLFPMTSRLSYASSPESDLDLTTDVRPLSLPECGSLSLVDRRLVKASSDPSIATQEDTGFNSAPPPYTPARPRQDHNFPPSIMNSQQPHSRESITSPRHRTSQDGRNEEYYSSRTALNHYSSLAMAEKRLSQVNGDVNAHQSWPPDRDQPHPGHNPDYINTSKSSSLERSNRKPGTFDNSSYSSDSFNKYSGNQIPQSQDNRIKRDSYNSVSLGQPQRPAAHDPYRYTRSTAQAQWVKPINTNGHVKQPPMINKYRQPDEKPRPPSPPPKPNIYPTRLQDGRPVPPPKPMHYQPRQWQQEDGTRPDMNFKRIPQDLASPGSRTSESMISSYIQNQTRRENSEYDGSSGVYGSRMYHPVEPPPRPMPPPVPEDPYQMHQKMSPGRRPYMDETGRGGPGNHNNYEMPAYAKGQGQSSSRPVAHVNGTINSYHNIPNSPRRDQSYYSLGHHHSSPPPSSLLDLSNRENRGSAFELYKKPDSRSPPGLSLHINSEQPKSRASSASSEAGHNVVAIARGVYNENGGVLLSEETGVSIHIPSGAIAKGEEQEIYFKVCQDSTMLPPLDKEKGETLLSPLVMCGPHGLQFKIPVELRLPHCAAVNPDSWSFALKSSETHSGLPEEWQNTSLDSRDGGTFSRINDNFVSVLVDHF